MSVLKKTLMAGCLWVTFMFIVMGLLWPWWNGDVITVRSLIGNFAAFFAGGVLYTYIMYRLIKRQTQRQA